MENKSHALAAGSFVLLLTAILASLAPAVVPYFYFVAEGHSGRHVFSTSLAEHNEAVQRYRATK